VTAAWSPAEARLVDLLADTARGPKRDGLFGLWLVLRCAESLLPPSPISERGNQRRLAALEKRLSALALAPPLRRALQAARVRLEPGDAGAAALALYELIAPAREALGPEAGDAVAAAHRAAKRLESA
jgi:hypothetical protein